ncbi:MULTISPECIES: FxDxF family PEP-CTERM protein [unclassified Janthinobacterium]|uniref:FxDxF family PEP-CTERM protein n=1 Tax=unclassified Janthinobacterium TaxID=2610881 RepID=UPI0008F52DFC|nr:MULTISPECIES: FxDxF family PEP-CTERM protein [unclassified Janthinobacterium]MDN2708410.1 FxDxF family PEP-CTERM protein [Janthinobacterium sp. SUN118]
MKHLIAAVAATLLSSAALASTPVLSNGGFENNTVGGGYVYGNVAPGWSFTGGAGVSASYTAWNGVAQEGNAFAFLQNTASISQSFVSSGAADYTFAFNLALRPGYDQGQAVTVSLDGSLLGQYAVTNTGWTSFNVNALNIGAGSHTLSFAGINPNNAYDTSAFLDGVSMNVSAVPEPGTYAMLLAGLGLLGFMARRRKTSV